MVSRLSSAAPAVLLVIALAPAGASAQTPTPAAPPAPPAATTPPAVAPTTPAEPGALAPPAATPPPAASGGVAPSAAPGEPVTPAPPAYLIPGPGAAQQPIAAVETLRDAEVPAEPLRIAALLAALLALLAIGGAMLLRALGLRTPVVDPVAVAPAGPLARLGDRARGLADDMRDFLRRSR